MPFPVAMTNRLGCTVVRRTSRVLHVERVLNYGEINGQEWKKGRRELSTFSDL